MYVDVTNENSAKNIDKFNKVVRINLRKIEPIYPDLSNFII